MSFSITGSGISVNLALPSPDQITLADIAINLATTNRFNGGGTVLRAGAPYSVAQHSCVTARIAAKVAPRKPLLALQALIHDAPEYLISDLTRPTREAMGDGLESYLHIHNSLYVAISAALGVPLPVAADAAIIDYCDEVALATEWLHMMPGRCPTNAPPANFGISPLNWSRAEQEFLKTFERLSIAAGISMPKPFNPVPTGILK